MKKEIGISLASIVVISLYQFTYARSLLFCCGLLLLGIVGRYMRSWRTGVWGVLFITVFSVRLWMEQHPPLFSEDEAVQGELVLNPNHFQVNGDGLSGIAEFEGKKIFFYKKLRSEEEQKFFQQVTTRIRSTVSGEIENLEHARNQGTFDAKNYYNSKGVYQRITVQSMEQFSLKQNRFQMIASWRKKLIHLLEKQPDSLLKTYALLFLFGERQFADETTVEHYQQLGIMHLLAISGLHMSLVISGCQSCLKRTRMTKEQGQWLISLLLLIYGVLIDWNVSGARAIWMFFLSVIAEKRGWSLSSLDRLGIVALGVLLIHPMEILGIGFQLSYVITAIVIIVGRWEKRVFSSRWVRTVTEPLFVALAALPLICQYFFVWNVWSLVLTPVLTIVFGVVLLPGSFLFAVWVFWGRWTLFSGIFYILESSFLWLNIFFEWCEQWQWSHITFGQWKNWQWIVYGVLLYATFTVMEQRRVSLWIKGVSFVFVCGFLGIVPYHWTSDVTVIDIGQGDAILFQTPGWNQATLVDTGGIVNFDGKESWRIKKKKSQAKDTLIPTLQAKGIASLKQVMLSHADWDHLGNLEELAKNIPIHTLTIAKGMEVHPMMQQFRQKNEHTRLFLVQKDSTYSIHGIQWRILSPKQLSKGENQDSIVALATLAGQTILMTGDAPSIIEEEICRGYETLPFTLLKVGHHGSKTSTSETLLQKSMIKAALISAGVRNRYHHPHPDTLERLHEYGIETFVTKEDGAIEIQFRPTMIRIQTILTKRKKEWKS